jgi:hypothetical protein
MADLQLKGLSRVCSKLRAIWSFIHSSWLLANSSVLYATCDASASGYASRPSALDGAPKALSSDF